MIGGETVVAPVVAATVEGELTVRRTSLSSILVCLGLFANGVANAEVLISAAEAAYPPAPPTTTLAMRSVSRAPVIVLASPPTGAIQKSPINLKIKFVPFGGTTIRPDSVRITYLKTPLIDLTPRVKLHVDDKGIEVPVAELPPGEHLIRVDLMDSTDHPGSTTITLKISP